MKKENNYADKLKEFKAILCEFPTGYGKTKTAIDIMRLKGCKNILIVVPRLVLIQNWGAELKKWGFDAEDLAISFITYNSLHKAKEHYDCIVFDEAQHISTRCQDIIVGIMNYSNVILLSATLKREHKAELQSLFVGMQCEKITFRKAVEDSKLPDPKVILIPLELDNRQPLYIFTKGKGKTVKCSYKDRFKFKNCRLEISCTQSQYYTLMSEQIEWFKQKSFGIQMFKNMWLHKAKQRLDWLALEKTDICKSILDKIQEHRTLTFCCNIDQTSLLGEYCINSKNKDSIQNLEDFNSEKINHITACNMLNEGMNLVNCKIGLYANLNSSEIIVKQRLGRILRHKEPVIIIPYYKGTRDQELVTKMLQDYNSELITICGNINNLEI